ncbi:MAG: hypothetical protein AAFR47_18140 [Pseudomonadota bacterium]
MPIQLCAVFGAKGVLASMMLALAMLTPYVNAASGPPRSVFLLLPETEPAPQVDLVIHVTDTGELDLMIVTTGFRFTTTCMPEAAAIPVGHAHIHVDGVKVASAYHPRVLLSGLTPGVHQINVVLRGQDHRALVTAGGLIAKGMSVEIPALSMG